MHASYEQVETEVIRGVRLDRFTSGKGSLEVKMIEATFR